MSEEMIAATEQPAPIATAESAPVLPVVLGRLRPHAHLMLAADLEARAALGLERYGTLLMTHNGRNALADLYQELLDALMYLAQYETETVSPLYSDFDELAFVAVHVKQRLDIQGEM